jgi:2-methylfumaryl-CoA isomerase
VLPAWDLLTGAYAAFALLAALRHRDVTGMGQEIRVPLSDVAIASAANLGMLAEALVTGAPRERLGNAVFGAFGRDFVTRDGRRLMILALTPKQWIGLLAALGIGEAVAALEAARGISFAKDEGLRFAHRDALFPLVEQAVVAQDYSPLVAALDAHGCCFGPYQSMLEAAHDRKLVSGNPVFGDSVNPSGIAYPAAGSFATIPQLDRASPRPAPRLGADTDAVLADLLGLSAGEIARLHDAGVVAQA